MTWGPVWVHRCNTRPWVMHMCLGHQLRENEGQMPVKELHLSFIRSLEYLRIEFENLGSFALKLPEYSGVCPELPCSAPKDARTVSNQHIQYAEMCREPRVSMVRQDKIQRNLNPRNCLLWILLRQALVNHPPKVTSRIGWDIGCPALLLGGGCTLKKETLGASLTIYEVLDSFNLASCSSSCRPKNEALCGSGSFGLRTWASTSWNDTIWSSANQLFVTFPLANLRQRLTAIAMVTIIFGSKNTWRFREVRKTQLFCPKHWRVC